MVLVPWALAIGFAIADEITFGKLLRIQYLNFRSTWEADGKPRGVLWIPAEARIGRWYVTYASGQSGQLARWRWLFRTPEWANESEDSLVLLRLHRIFMPAFVAAAIAPFVIAALMQKIPY
jgi:hypothetical protein